ncbi:MAG: low temperature requirement protein A [Methanobrevibacter sp.]|uniref:low temperature requirement protein A n=1 Tax=Methanobrevibacter sp. TaxID=66852 RepID=UPI0025FA4292|nr:low temperature requirement protein A [Methanobrevibacter sp.]MBR0271642.1 low temperature requirement protein A [Methanobrevibacter sp.]
MVKIIKKEVKLIELFYDLLYVYAISQLTSLINEPVGDMVPLGSIFVYVITSFVILQAWLYFTNYVNRYGEWKGYEYVLACVNMIAVIFMTNTISTHLSDMLLPFNVSMLILLLTVVALYSVRAYDEKSLSGAAGNSITILSIVCAIYVIAIIALLQGFGDIVIWIDVVAVLCGAFLPFFIRGKFDKNIINFPHLVERFELLTIITFGEAIVGMTHFFDVSNLTLIPILVFLIIITMFGCYVVQIHELMSHFRQERSLRLMFSHYFVIISINLMTVAFELLHSGHVNHLFNAVLIIISLIVFYVSIMANKEYYADGVVLSVKEIIEMLIFIIIGAGVILLFLDNIYAFLIGALIITAGNLFVLVEKLRSFPGK